MPLLETLGAASSRGFGQTRGSSAGGWVTSGLQLFIDPGTYSGSGSTFADRSTNGYTVTLNGSPTWSSSNGGYFTYNGTSQYLEVAHNDNIQPVSNLITVICAFYATAAGSISGSILYNKENMYEASAGGGFVTYAFQPYWAWVGDTAFNQNQWYIHAVTYDNTNQTMYQSSAGALSQVFQRAQTGVMGAPGQQTALRIAARGSDGPASSFYQGRIGAFMMYNRALSGAELTTNFNFLKGRYGL